MSADDHYLVWLCSYGKRQQKITPLTNYSYNKKENTHLTTTLTAVSSVIFQTLHKYNTFPIAGGKFKIRHILFSKTKFDAQELSCNKLTEQLRFMEYIILRPGTVSSPFLRMQTPWQTQLPKSEPDVNWEGRGKGKNFTDSRDIYIGHAIRS